MTRAARLLLALLVAAAAVVLQPAGASATERTVTYTASSQGAVAADLGHFAAVARDALSDPRGWSLGGTLGFEQVGSGGAFDLILASPSVIANASPGCSAQWSCRVGRSVYINDERWRFATDSWTHGLDLYQRYVILHEVGHWIGLGHTDCPTSGRTAWVMQQQSISLQGCLANVWPVIAERELAARKQGVSVNWSPIENHYRATGLAGGLLDVPVSWEQRSADGAGSYQHFRGAGGASIFWSPRTGAHVTSGPLRQQWAELGWEWSRLGYPVTSPARSADQVGYYQHFEGADGSSIFWTPRTGAHEIWGAIRQRWIELGWEWSPLGYPVTSPARSADGVGLYQHFEGSGGASIFWTPGTGAHEVWGPIRQRWAELGWEWSALGYPTRGVRPVEGGSRADFQGGSITLDAATGQTQVVLD